MRLLESYSWPGNVRELENVVELIINTEAFPYKYFSENSEQPSPMAQFAAIAGNLPIELREERLEDLDPAQLDLSYMEKEHIKRVLKLYKGNISQTAAALGIQRNTLYSKISKYEIQLEIGHRPREIWLDDRFRKGQERG